MCSISATRRIRFALALVALFASGSAEADDLPGRRDMFDWTGLYAGLQMGYGWSKADYSDEDYLSFPDPDGFVGGLYVGYNYQAANRIVVGIDADITYSDMNGADPQRLDDDPSISFPGTAFDVNLKWSGAIRGRIGYAAGPFLPYIAGGVSFLGYDSQWEDHVNNVVPFRHSETLVGWNVGGGFDYAATANWILRAEYRYTNFGTDNYPNSYSGPLTKLEVETHDIRFGAAYRF